MRQLSVQHLSTDNLARAFTLVQAAVPCVTYDAWARHARALTCASSGKSGGILCAEGPRGLFAGLASYQVHHSLLHGPVLLTTDFIAFDLFRREEIAQALVQALECEAEQRGCRAVQFSLSRSEGMTNPSWLKDFLHNKGHLADGASYCKPLPQRTRIS